MVRTNELKEIIKSSGKSVTYLAKKLGVSRQALYLKLNNNSEFLSVEVKVLCSELNITSLRDKERIFFSDEVD